jgi:hypothetical protein
MVGWTGIFRYVLNWNSWEDVSDWWRIIQWPVLLTICQLAVLIQLLVILRRHRRAAAAAAAPAASESSKIA